MRRTLIFPLALALAISACASTAPVTPVVTPVVPVIPVTPVVPAPAADVTVSTPQAQITAQQAVFAARATYGGLALSAVTYKGLTPCSAVQKLPCSDAAIVAQLQKADNVALPALDAAEAAVRTPSIGSTARDYAVQAALAAVAALKALIPAILGVTQ